MFSKHASSPSSQEERLKASIAGFIRAACLGNRYSASSYSGSSRSDDTSGSLVFPITTTVKARSNKNRCRNINTTVSMRRQAPFDVAKAFLPSPVEGLKSTTHMSYKAPVPAQTSPEDSSKDEKQQRWKEAFKEVLAPSLMALPIQLAAPPAGFSGLAMSMAPAPPPMPPLPGMPPMQDDDQFAALIFPGFDSNAFIWKVTCFQAAEFGLSMFLGHNKANPTPCVLYNLGASWGPAIARGQLWRLITPVMLHANLTHLLFNVFFQLRMGFGMEKQFGKDKMMLLYASCGVFGNLMSVCADPFKLAVGASTAGFGLIGVWLAEILLSWEVLGPNRERTVIWIAFMLISVTTMTGMTPNMDLYGHLGGALGGFLLAILISDMERKNRPEWYPQARVAAALCLAMFLVGGLGKALHNPTDPLPDCDIGALFSRFKASSAKDFAGMLAAAKQ
eukprot:TRINITY_DN65579_c0_g1_i1.p1 TRINITY_DN65579_c0_g1~~TRINITY_DN65579_c0_g1_i1.p1  ORF type:complete len:448 (-),score=106.67 TRINITY_DN65579_c0_g1_i1:85-1428(-)